MKWLMLFVCAGLLVGCEMKKTATPFSTKVTIETKP
jgi:hypothetical protein